MGQPQGMQALTAIVSEPIHNAGDAVRFSSRGRIGRARRACVQGFPKKKFLGAPEDVQAVLVGFLAGGSDGLPAAGFTPQDVQGSPLVSVPENDARHFLVGTPHGRGEHVLV